MRKSAQLLLSVLCMSLLALGVTQPETKAIAQITDFEIDSNKPYVYLEFDHVGPRKPLRDGEPNTGIYLRLKNNCRLPVVIVALEAPSSDSKAAISIEDEVVPDPQGPGGDAVGGVAYIQSGVPGLGEMDDIFRWPNTNEAEVRGAAWVEKNAPRDSKSAPERPHGYNGTSVPGSRMLTLIPPGGQVVFSVPSNHVGKTWHLEIPFRFAFPRKSVRPPYSYVAFFEQDLPTKSGAATLSPPGAVILNHELGHSEGIRP